MANRMNHGKDAKQRRIDRENREYNRMINAYLSDAEDKDARNSRRFDLSKLEIGDKFIGLIPNVKVAKPKIVKYEEVITETEKAVMISFSSGKHAWFPKQLIMINFVKKAIIIPVFVAREKGL